MRSCRQDLLGCGHRQRELRDDIGVQPNLYLILTGGLDVPGQFDAPFVQVGATGGLDRLGNLARSDRPEQSAAGAGPNLKRDLQSLELLPDLLGVTQVPDLAGRTRPADRADLLLATLGPVDRESLREQIVATVSVLDFHNVARRAEARHFLREDDLHFGPPLSDRWWCRPAEPSHARS